MASKKKLLQAAAGSAGGAGLDVDEVFSTYLINDNSNSVSPTTVTNGIDLSGEGGMVWVKSRTSTQMHSVTDTERGVLKQLNTDNTNAEYAGSSDAVDQFNSDGFRYANGYAAAQDYVSWTFRKAPKFFDVVTYTGTGANRTISHNLNSEVGFMVIKRLDSTGGWIARHRTFSTNENCELNNTNASFTASGYITSTTSTTFTIGNNGDINQSGSTYVAYLFAHNDGDGEFGPNSNQDIIKCGSFTASSSKTASINLGFEPQWLMIKSSSVAEEWIILDNMRGLILNASDHALFSNSNIAEETGKNYVNLTPTGFDIEDNVTGSADYIYMAIRRDSLAEPENATDVFSVNEATNPRGFVTTGFPVDLHMQRKLESGDGFNLADRLRGERKFLYTTETSSEYTFSSTFPAEFDHMNGIDNYSYSSQTKDTIFYNWKRAPSYFDVVAYTGTGSNRTVSHNLGVVPEMMWIKRRNTTGSWAVFHKDLNTTSGEKLNLNSTNAVGTNTAFFNSTVPTSSVFTVGTSNNTNASSGTYIAYLFATLAGISKVGSFTGNGSTTGDSQNIDCGFSSGARFVLIKPSSDSGDWSVYDSTRGIVAGNDARLMLDRTDAEETGDDRIDPLSSGFTVVHKASGRKDCNTNGVTYIFYAIA